jgi:putative membrane protein
MLSKLSALPILAFVTLCAPLQAIAQTQQSTPSPPDYYWPGPGHMMWGGGYGWPFWGMFPMMILFMILLCAAVFYFGRMMCMGGRHAHWGPPEIMMHGGPPTYSALQILNERFARGDIQKPEYEEKKAAILFGGRR